MRIVKDQSHDNQDDRAANWLRFLLDESGQDLIEYALLTAFIGFAGIFIWTNIMSLIGTKYSGWDAGVQGLSACTPDPGATTCP
jgi:Flp pilus assembly pilin Flp